MTRINYNVAANWAGNVISCDNIIDVDDSIIANARFDWDAHEIYGYYLCPWSDGDADVMHELFPDLLISYSRKLAKYVLCYDHKEDWTNTIISTKVVTAEPASYTINPDTFDVEAIISEFAAHGFSVSKAAIMHNYKAWNADMKSGYRCRNCHLFTPCGCNDLSFTATELRETRSKAQITYVA